MAHITFQTYLMWKDGATWKKLVDIRDFPDLQGDPNMLDTTTLSEGEETQTPGIKRASEKKFKALYKRADFVKILGKENTTMDIGVWIGGLANGTPTGHFGRFNGKGIPSVKMLGKGVDEVTEMEITFAMVKPFELIQRIQTIVATKVWKGGVPASRPEVYFKLFRQQGSGAKTAVPGAAVKKIPVDVAKDVLTVSWEDLVVHQNGDDHYVFSVEETNAGGTATVPTGYTKVENGLTVTNTKS